MENVKKFIIEKKLFKSGCIVGVAVSGGTDSMALLHFLNENKFDLDIELVAIHIDHCLRETSGADAAFVARFCRENHIRFFKFKIDVNTLIKEKNLGTEEAAREARYGVFEACIKKGLVEKIALAHHVSDQAETVLLHILRGSGLNGAKGMDLVRGNYVRPFLKTEKNEILRYITEHNIEYVEDESNNDIKFSRNFIRNKIMPLIKQNWKNAEKNLASFSEICKVDDDYINQFALTDGIFANGNFVKIPLSYFTFNDSILNRIIFKALNMAGINEDFERRHINLIKELCNNENGTKIDLPSGAKAIKEYEYITIIKKPIPKLIETFKFKCGKTVIKDFGTLLVKKSTSKQIPSGNHLIDFEELPKDAVWRVRKEGDFLSKFGGGTKKLRTYLIEKKIPSRLRNNIPVLASGNEVFVVAAIAISGKLKVTDKTKTAYSIEYLLN